MELCPSQGRKSLILTKALYGLSPCTKVFFVQYAKDQGTRVRQEGHENGVRQTSKEKNHCSDFTDRHQAKNAKGAQSEHSQEGTGSSHVVTGRVG